MPNVHKKLCFLGAFSFFIFFKFFIAWTLLFGKVKKKKKKKNSLHTSSQTPANILEIFLFFIFKNKYPRNLHKFVLKNWQAPTQVNFFLLIKEINLIFVQKYNRLLLITYYQHTCFLKVQMYNPPMPFFFFFFLI